MPQAAAQGTGAPAQGQRKREHGPPPRVLAACHLKPQGPKPRISVEKGSQTERAFSAKGAWTGSLLRSFEGFSSKPCDDFKEPQSHFLFSVPMRNGHCPPRL